MALSAIELFSGTGMLGEGVRAGFRYLGVEYSTVCHVEREAYAASVLASRMEEESMDAAPVWSDVCTFDARAWRGVVDIVVAGFPCQDISVAGRRTGLDGKRSGLFFEVVRIATDSDARFIVLENVSGIASATASAVDEGSASDYAAKPNGEGFSDVGIEDGRLFERAAARVVGELADLGWDSEWIVVSASDVGASHDRARWFCFAWRKVADVESQRGGKRVGNEFAWRTEIESASEKLGDASSIGRWTQGDSEQQSARLDRCDDALADTGSTRREGRGGGCGMTRKDGKSRMDQLANAAVYSHQSQMIPDGPTSLPALPLRRLHLNPLFGAWLMGWPLTWVIAEPRASGASETELFRSVLQQHLSSLLGEQESLKECDK